MERLTSKNFFLLLLAGLGSKATTMKMTNKTLMMLHPSAVPSFSQTSSPLF